MTLVVHTIAGCRNGAALFVTVMRTSAGDVHYA